MKGKIVTPDQVIDGELVFEGDTITCVAVSCTDPPGATRITVTNAYILLGFVDAHNHVAYNVLPRWTPPKLYQNRGRVAHGGLRGLLDEKPTQDLQVPLEPSRLEPRRSKWWWCSPHEPSAPATLEDRRQLPSTTLAREKIAKEV